MLAKTNRLKKEKDFKKIYRFGKKKKATFFIIRYLPNKFIDSRFGIVVPTTTTKKAVIRNLIRRKISEIIRLNLGKIKKGYDIIFLVFKLPTKDKYQILEKEILTVFQEIGLYSND